MSKKSGVGKFIAGAAIGAGLGILFAPKKGSETRKKLKEKIDDMVIKIKSVDAEDIKNQAVKEGMNTLKMAAANGVKEGITSIAEMIKATYEAEEEEKK